MESVIINYGFLLKTISLQAIHLICHNKRLNKFKKEKYLIISFRRSPAIDNFLLRYELSTMHETSVIDR